MIEMDVSLVPGFHNQNTIRLHTSATVLSNDDDALSIGLLADTVSKQPLTKGENYILEQEVRDHNQSIPAFNGELQEI